MAIYSQLSLAKKKKKKKKKNVKMAIYRQLALAKKMLKRLSTVRKVIICLTIWEKKVILLFIMLKVWGIIFSDILA